MNLRKGDFLQSEAKDVNAILDRLNSEGNVFRKNIDKISSVIDRLEKQDSVNHQIQNEIDQLKTAVKPLKDALTQWRLKPID